MFLAVLLKLNRDMALVAINDQEAIFPFRMILRVLIEMLNPLKSNLI